MCSRKTFIHQQYQFSPGQTEWLLNEGVYLGHGQRETDKLYED